MFFHLFKNISQFFYQFALGVRHEIKKNCILKPPARRLHGMHPGTNGSLDLRFKLGFGHTTVIVVNKLFQILTNIMLLPTI